MALSYTLNNKSRLIADKYYQLKKIKSKLQRKAADIGFVRKALSQEVTPTFAKVKGQFKSINDKWKAERIIMESQLKDHYKHMKLLTDNLCRAEHNLKQSCSSIFYNFITRRINDILREERIHRLRSCLV